MSYLEIIRAQRTPLPAITQSCNGQTIIVTGANTGLGFEATQHFVRLNASRVIMAVRSISKGEHAKAKIEAATSRFDVLEVWELDLASHESIRAFSMRASKELDRIDAVIENAGVAMEAWTGVSGVETTIAVNVIGTMLLATLLMPCLRSSGRRWSNVPRLTIVSSELHAAAKFVEGKAEDIFAALALKNERNMGDRYNVSKLLQVYAIRHLAAQLPVPESGVILNLVTPGLCSTEIDRHMSTASRVGVSILRLFMGRTAEEGSRTLLFAALAGKESHGKYLSDCEIKDHWVASFVTTEEGEKMQKKVWAQLASQLEALEPGCVAKALEVE